MHKMGWQKSILLYVGVAADVSEIEEPQRTHTICLCNVTDAILWQMFCINHGRYFICSSISPNVCMDQC